MKQFGIRIVLTVGWVVSSRVIAFAQPANNNNTAPVHLQVQRLNDSYIDVYYNKPISDRKLPVLIFCQGSGYDSNTDGFLGVMRPFQAKAVGLVIEKEGVTYGDQGDSMTTAYKANNSVYNRLYDYLRVLQYLRVHAEWWNGDLYVIGGSEGGLLAGMLACYYTTTKGLALFSFGGGLNFGEAWPIASGIQVKAEGADEAAVERAMQRATDTLALTREEPTFSKSYEGEDNTYAWWASIIDLRLQNALMDLKVPIFLAQGSEDMMAPPISAQKLRDQFVNSGRMNLYYKEYKGFDHEYKDPNGKSHLVDVINEGLLWIFLEH